MAELLLTEENHVKTYLVQDSDRPAIIKKVLDISNPTEKQIRDFQFEFKLLKGIDLEGVRKPVEIKTEKDHEIALYEYFEGLTLKNIIQSGKTDLSFILQSAIFLAHSLSTLHGKGVIHKSINSHNILFNPDNETFCLIDFSHASTFHEKKHHLGNPTYIAGDLGYVSPEQTGRMNRRVDARSDFYSMGVVLYEMLTGSLPFADNDLLELVHAHIAKKPDMDRIFNQYPRPVAEIVEKLLSKEAELRYQSGAGLKYDLQKCLDSIKTGKTIKDFVIASKDFATELRVSQKLYGRSKEIDILISEFNNVLKGPSSTVMVSGYSGVGKSVLVYEVYKSISRAKGYFIKGKYDQLQRNIPYYAIVQALNEYVTYLLTEPEALQSKVRKGILEALGAEGKLITDIAPAFELIIGEQPEVPKLSGQEAQNRFNYIFLKLIKSITSIGNPVVLFIDDLQWADLASLQLISNLLRDDSVNRFLFVGSFRDNEITDVHPLTTTLHDLENSKVRISNIKLEGLSIEDVSQLLADTLSLPLADVADLGILIQHRTRGNAFYVNQILTTLFNEGQLAFNPEKTKWEWSEDDVKNLKISENVVELLASRINRLDAPVQKMLQTASCIGNYFELEQLYILLDPSEIDIDRCITVGLEEELIENSEMGYAFVHDRIQQAIYSLIDAPDQILTHLKIGRTLLEKKKSTNKNIFEIVDQLNAGKTLVVDDKEKAEYVKLNFDSGLRAKSSTAYDSALGYFKAAMYFSNNDWKNNYDLLLALYSNASEVAYLSGDYKAVEQYREQVLNNAVRLLDKIPVYRIHIESLKSQNKLPEAVEKGLEVLRKLGIKMPYKPTKLRVMLALMNVKLNLVGRNVENLLDLKKMSDPNKLASMQVLVSIGPAIYWASPNLIPMTIFNMLLLSIKNGNTDESTFAYSTYGLVLCGITGQIRNGNRFGDLALKLSKRVNGPNQVKGIFNVYCFVNHWKYPLNNSFKPFQRTFQLGMENGDLEFAALSAYLYCNHKFYSGYNLTSLDEEMAVYCKEIRQIKQYTSLNYNLLHWQATKCLIGESTDPMAFDGPVYYEKKKLAIHREAGDHTALFKYHLLKLMLNCIYNKYEMALEHAREGVKFEEAVTGMFVTPVFHYYHGLALAGHIKDGRDRQSGKRINKLKTKLKMFKKWAKNCPENHEHRYLLLLAEYSSIVGNDNQAKSAYSRAIVIADKNGFIQDKALASELTGRYYFDQNEKNLGYYYLTNSYQSYQAWGASSKCQELSQTYDLNNYFKKHFGQLADLLKADTTESALHKIDINTVIKASTAIAEDINFERLKTRLMKILVENVGAERGVLLIPEKGKLKVEKEWPESDEINYAVTMVSLAEKTKKPIVSGNAEKDQTFGTDPHIITEKVKSVLCFPLLHHGELLAVVYLENNLVLGAFSEDRIEMLKLLSGQIAISLKNSLLFTNLGKSYQQQVDLKQAYSRFVPMEFLKFLGKDSILEVELGDQVQKEVTIMFIDIKDYTSISEKMTPKENFNFINACLRRVGPVIDTNEGFICQFLGDGLMAIFKGEAQNALTAAVLIQEEVMKFNSELGNRLESNVSVGIGLHTGKVMLGIIGDSHRMDQNVISDTVNISSRVQNLTRFYGASVIVTKQFLEKVPADVHANFRKLGRVLVKGKLKEIEIYECLNGLDKEQYKLKMETKNIFDEGLASYYKKEFSAAALKFDQVKQINPNDKASLYFLERSAFYMTQGVPEGWTGVDIMLHK